MKRLAAIVSVAIGAVGCGSFASSAEYGAYRASAASPSLEGRLAAADAYLHEYPKGAWSEEVHAWYRRAELLYWRSKRGSAAGLSAYLRTLPAGPHGVAAARRLDEIQEKSAKGDALARQALATEARLERASSDRARVRGEVRAWIGRFLEPDSFRVPIAEARAELVIPWALSLPSPRCAERLDPARPRVARRCVKLEELGYLVVGPKGGEAREATLEIAVDEDEAGVPRAAVVRGPELFLRLEEAAVVRAFDPANPDHRMAGIARGVALVSDVFARKVSPDAACQRPVVAPVVLDLAWHGVPVTERAGTEPGDDDVVTVRPER